MIKALMWKEWRQQRRLLYAFVGIVVVHALFVMSQIATGGASFSVTTFLGIMFMLQMFLFVPIIACFSGAMTFAEDRSEGTLSFLMSRPASVSEVWATKVGVAALAVVAAGLLVSVEVVVVSMAAGELPLAPVLSGRRLATLLEVFWVSIGILSLPFGASVYFSTRSKRPFSAVLLAILATLLMSMLIGTTGATPGLGAELATMLVGLAFLLASYQRFRTTEVGAYT